MTANDPKRTFTAMKNILLIILIVASSRAMALGPTNVCSDSKSISEFSKLYVTEKTSLEDSHISWDINVPNKYLDKYQLVILYLVMYEEGNDVLRVPIHTSIKDGMASGIFIIEKETEKTIKLFAYYSEKPGVVVFDGDRCEFILE